MHGQPHIRFTFCEFNPFSTFFLVITDLQGSLSVCFPLTQYVSNFQHFKYTPRPCFTSVCFTHFCFNAFCQFTPLLNLCSLIFSLMPLWLVNLCLFEPLFFMGLSFFIYAFLIYAQFFKECNYSIKQGLGVPVILC